MIEKNHPITLDFDDGGNNGLPVIFLHSLGGSSSHWIYQLKHLRKTRRAIAIDWRGHGKSKTSSFDNLSLELLAEDVEKTINQTGIKKFILAAHSGGASVATAFLKNNEDKVACYLLVDPSGDARMVPKEASAEFMKALESDAYEKVIEEHYLSILADGKEETKRIVLDDLKAVPKEIVVGVFGALTEFDPVTPLKRYKGKMLSVITRFNKDPMSLQNLYPELNYVEITGTSHWLHMDRPEEFNEILDDFILQVEKEK